MLYHDHSISPEGFFFQKVFMSFSIFGGNDIFFHHAFGMSESLVLSQSMESGSTTMSSIHSSASSSSTASMLSQMLSYSSFIKRSQRKFLASLEISVGRNLSTLIDISPPIRQPTRWCRLPQPSAPVIPFQNRDRSFRVARCSA